MIKILSPLIKLINYFIKYCMQRLRYQFIFIHDFTDNMLNKQKKKVLWDAITIWETYNSINFDLN